MGDRSEEPISRRFFLAGTVSGAGAASMVAAGSMSAAKQAEARTEEEDLRALSANRPAKKFPDVDYDVIVVGGGFSGVTAARDCMKNGYQTLLLEARNRLGGRVFSSEFEGHKIELGGTWIHWAQPHVWAEVQRYGHEIIETPGAVTDQMWTQIDGAPYRITESDFGELIEAYLAYTAEAREIWARPYDRKFSWDKIIELDNIAASEKLRSLNLSNVAYRLMEAVLSTAIHNTIDQASYVETLRYMSLSAYSDFPTFMDAIARYKLKDGTESLINDIIEDGGPEVRLSTVVAKIENLDGHDKKVRITTEDGAQIACAAVIVTLPMNVLPNVEFSPPLDTGVKDAGALRHPGQGAKVYAKTIGSVGNVAYLGAESDPINWAMTYKDEKDYTLLVCFGNDRERLDIYDSQSVQEALALFNPDIQIASVVGYDWVFDPFSQGTYCSYRPGWFQKYSDMFQKDIDRILFASGDHGDGWRGTIDGAIAAGESAARRVNLALKEVL